MIDVDAIVKRRGGGTFVKREGRVYHFVCECKTPFTITGRWLSANTTPLTCRSCRDKAQRSVFDPDWGLARVYRKYRADASKAQRPFELSVREVQNLISEPCHYCGYSKSNRMVHRTHAGVDERDAFCYNGIDRVDNDKGYVEGNVVSCCFICNRAKNSMKYSSFVKWADRLAVFRNEQAQ